ncbi:MAG TPA: hypothetical protein PKE30_11490 [Niabella sp.]|nr:hypothetical protein [Niabella sp.]
MRKGFFLILFLAYGFASFGFSLNYFYCCGELKEVKISLHTQHEDDCGMEMGDKKCCDNKSLTLKVSSDQKPNLQQEYNFQQLSFTAAEPAAYHDLLLHSSLLKAHPQYYNLPPPLVSDRTVLYANFRI